MKNGNVVRLKEHTSAIPERSGHDCNPLARDSQSLNSYKINHLRQVTDSNMFVSLDNLETFRQDSTMKNEIDFQPTAAETILLNIGTVFLMALGMVNAFAVTTLIQKVF